ncbi:MAG: tRNA (adenosine(37)-N6)-threonylcarbamoyltransferase complex transferase subunit TsaD [Gemmatimonadetes bacterium]|nr:tRNA (adenosine(37)-N6)-threonylcarbamoyltransferase complex transferase subunit TsaD [Gemmatimonadota bacterium]
MSGPLVLGIETSCDETSAAVLRGERELLGHVILSQDVHAVYGGVVPELAARAHMRTLDDVVARALAAAPVGLGDLDAIGVTVGPGLIGALLVGVSWAKAAAYALGRPLVPVHHMEAHLFAPSLEDPQARPPFVALLVSGGHTLLLWVPAWGEYRLLGETRDDAAGEAFDKVAKLLGLPYPGGPPLERLAREGDGNRHAFPRPMLHGGQMPGDPDYYDFSFSGLKTAVALRVAELEAAGSLEEERAHVAAGFQDAVLDVLVTKAMRASEETRCRRVLLGGGVAANRGLREELARRLGPEGRLLHSSPRLAVDNGAMVARAAVFHLARQEVAGPQASARADLPFPVRDWRLAIDN